MRGQCHGEIPGKAEIRVDMLVQRDSSLGMFETFLELFLSVKDWFYLYEVS